MSVEIRVPALGESVSVATVGRWMKKLGDTVQTDEAVVELETDKVTVDVPAPAAGVMQQVSVAEGDEVHVGDILGVIGKLSDIPVKSEKAESQKDERKSFPAARKMMAENNVQPDAVPAGSGLGGRITKGDVQAFLAQPPVSSAPPAAAPRQDDPREERVPMTRLRRTIARRLKDAQNTAAMLTTFNEVDMTAAKEMRAEFQDRFVKKYGVKLGFMSIFSKAVIAALQEFPELNAEIDGNDLVYRNFVNLGIAVGGPSGLVVPVIRDAEKLSHAEIEKKIGDFAQAVRGGTLKIDDLAGGTFSITNGGIYGSMLSTPILNAPQSGILGMHNIVDRPVAINGKVEIRPIMYVALSYDHRVVDGKEAVSFLVAVKKYVEDPRSLLLGL